MANEPAGQLGGALIPTLRQYLSLSPVHSMHLSFPELSEYVTAVHGVQDVCVELEPALHAKIDVIPEFGLQLTPVQPSQLKAPTCYLKVHGEHGVLTSF